MQFAKNGIDHQIDIAAASVKIIPQSRTKNGQLPNSTVAAESGDFLWININGQLGNPHVFTFDSGELTS